MCYNVLASESRISSSVLLMNVSIVPALIYFLVAGLK